MVERGLSIHSKFSDNPTPQAKLGMNFDVSYTRLDNIMSSASIVRTVTDKSSNNTLNFKKIGGNWPLVASSES